MESYTANGKPEKRWTASMEFPPSDGGLSNDDVATAARVSATVLLTGPARMSLTAARRIHDESERREGPFTVVDGGGPATAVIESLVETLGDPQATSRRATRAAGTVYLKNVGALPGFSQRLVARLLAHPRRNRLIASTPYPLLERVINGQFDDSLFYRLNVMHFLIAAK
jgi:DNA-binding NtrC family response regulator